MRANDFQAKRIRFSMRAATKAAFHAPAETPMVMAGFTPSSRSRSMAPT
jgi:hypothetical protein